MAMRPPGREELIRLAALNHFKLSEEELNIFLPLMAPMFHGLDELDRMPEPERPLKYYERDPGARPHPMDDPFNAILRRCSVKGARSGKLAGKRVGIKDCVLMAGVPMSCGSLMLDGYIPDRDATIVTRMLDAGAEIVAKLNMDDMAFSGSGDSSAFGPVLNPHSPEHFAGGSSAGSGAALYYDFIDLTIGGDQGGSIRIPSSFCGVVGLKPTHGLVPYTDIIGIDPTIDHIGPMARTVSDVALLLDVIADKVPVKMAHGGVRPESYTESLDKGVAGLKIGVVRQGFGWEASEEDVDSAVRRAIDALAGLGAEVEEVSIPLHRRAARFLTGITSGGLAALLANNGMVYHTSGTYNHHLAAAIGRGMELHADDLPPLLKFNLMLGTYLNRRYHGRMYAKAQNLRGFLREQYDQALMRVDVLAMPTTPTTAVKDEPNLDARARMMRGWHVANNTAAFDVTGHPSLSVPCAKSKGLPVGLMLTGRHFEDATLLRAAFAFERNVAWEKV
jgi:amidase